MARCSSVAAQREERGRHVALDFVKFNDQAVSCDRFLQHHTVSGLVIIITLSEHPPFPVQNTVALHTERYGPFGMAPLHRFQGMVEVGIKAPATQRSALLRQCSVSIQRGYFPCALRFTQARVVWSRSTSLPSL